VCIIDGGIKMKVMKYKAQQMHIYKCTKCEKLWSLNSGCIVLSGRNRIFDGYSREGRKQWRVEGHCSCGTIFDYPMKTKEELNGE